MRARPTLVGLTLPSPDLDYSLALPTSYDTTNAHPNTIIKNGSQSVLRCWLLIKKGNAINPRKHFNGYQNILKQKIA